MNFVEKHSKLLAVALCLCASGPILSTVHAYEVQPGWHSNGEVSYYVMDNHQKAKGLTEIENDTYYFDQSGVMQYGWQNVANKTYYFDNNGKAVTGKTEIQGTTYNFQDTGSLNQGWDDTESYYNEKGFKVASGWVNDQGAKYYFDENGNKIKDTWKEIDGNQYYFNGNGQVNTGEFDVDGSKYYTDDQGILNVGWKDVDGNRFYFNTDGSKNMDSYKEIDGVTYAFNEDGSLLTNAERDNYIIDANGVATVKPEPVAPAPGTEDETVNDAPVVDEPVVDAPVVNEPVVDAPVVNEPVVDQPVVDEPVVNEPVVDTPVVDAPVVNEPVVDQPVVDAPVVDTPVVNEPVVNEPVVDQPVVNEPVVNEPVVETPVVNNDKASAIANAALSQVGVNQDCTMLVTNSLAAVGIYFHGWPEEYASLGDWTSNPVPGDIIIYSGHVAVYIGNGQAVHGGWNGNTTVVFSVNCSQALIGYIHVR